MKKGKVLFVPQNGEHLLNMNPVIEVLRKEKIGCHYLDTNHLFFQNLEYPEGIVVIRPFKERFLSESFYNISSLDRIKMVFRLKDIAPKIVMDYDLIVVGNDGAVQRQLIYYAKKQNKPCVMILDGIITPPVLFNFKDVLKNSENRAEDLMEYFKKTMTLFISRLFSKTILSPYFPSVIGCGNLNHIYAIGKYSKDVIENYVPRSTKVINTGLPRMAPYFKKERKESFLVKIPLSVCFITSAYKWHGLHSYHDYQIKDILLIKSCLKKIYPNQIIPLYIKLHPRERAEDYSQLKKIEGVFLVERESFMDSIYNYRVLLSNLSTCIVEGLNHGVEVASLMINFPYWKVKKGFLSSNYVIKLFSEQDLIEYLKLQLKYPENFYQDEESNDFLSTNTVFSKDIIAAHITSLLPRFEG